MERGLHPPAVGEDLAGPRIEGGRRLPRPGRAAPRPGQARLRRRGLRVHDLHRQLGPAAPAGRRRGRRARAGAGVGPVRQPQLRGPHQPRRPHELPGLAPAGRGLRAGGHDGHRPHDRAARHRSRRQRRPPARPVADRRPRSTRSSRRRSSRRCSRAPTARSSTATSCGAACRWPRAVPTSGRTRRRTSGARPTSTACPTTPTPLTDVEGARALALLGDSVTTDHISPCGRHPPRQPRRAVADRPRRRPARTSTRTARGAATTR